MKPNTKTKSTLFILSELEVLCMDEDELYGASVLASAIHYLITGRTFSANAVGKPFGAQVYKGSAPPPQHS